MPYSKIKHGSLFIQLLLKMLSVANGCFVSKRKVDGSIERYKARFVAKGFHQQPGVDYCETYSPIIKPTTVRIVLSSVISSGWPIRQIDIQNAFLHRTLSEEVFMTQPLRNTHPQFPHHICKLQKAIHGLNPYCMNLAFISPNPLFFGVTT